MMNHNSNQINKTSIRRYGWRRQLPDARDEHYAVPAHEPVSMADLRGEFMPSVYDQGALGSCTANAIAAAFEFCEAQQEYPTGEQFTPSRLFIYYNERSMEGSTSSDAGAEIRDGIKSIGQLGVCPETEWPYDVDKFTEQPSDKCYRDALRERALKYQKVPQTINGLKHALGTEHQPVVFGFVVYASFESDEVKQTGVMPMPKPGEKTLGGHAVMAVGFDDDKQAVLVRNSWGPEWGEEGYFWMPYEFITNPDQADDFWTVQTIAAPAFTPPVQGNLYDAHFPALPEATQTPAAADAAPLECPGTQVPELSLCGLFAGKGVECRAGRKTTINWSTKGKVARVNVQYCVNSWTGMLSSWTTTAESLENTGSYEWPIPEDASADTRYWLRVSSAEDSAVYSDSDYFAVVASEDTCSC